MRGIAELGTLREVELRLAWPHEAHGFTRWLAEHLDLLASEVGISLEREGVEVAVGSFWADILARNTLDGSLVLIENQLEVSDHDHLGKIMTYLAGLEAKTIIWVARRFRDEHLSAIRWLNDHTTDPFAFFAVRIKVMQIGDSPLAPVFEILERPNEWERQLQATSRETQADSELGQRRKEFWTYYLSRYPQEAQHGPAQAVSNRWRTLEGLDIVLSYWIANINAGIFIRGNRGAKGREVYEALAPHATELSAIAGAEIGSPGSRYFFISRFPADWSDKSQWERIADWLYETANRYERSIRELFGQSPSPTQSLQS